MKSLRSIYHFMRADFLERIRRDSFLFVLALMVCAGYLFVPPEGASYLVLQLGLKRGIYNSPWIGLMFGLIAALHLPLFGFYLIKNAVERDRQTRVGQIIAATPTSKPVYVVGKWLSNSSPALTPSPPHPLTPASCAHLTPLVVTPNRGRFFGVLAAELKLMLRGHSLMWYAGAIGLIIACLASPLDGVQRYLLPAIWLWPVLIWSQMGIRERLYNTGQMVFSAPRPVARQLSALWLAGVILTVIVGSGAWMRLVLMGEITSLLAWFVGALFTPALALALGVWVGNSRAFEALYLFWWYIGVINQVPAFDYAGATAAGLAMGMPVVYLGITAGLVVLAVIGRRRQIQV